MGTVWPALHYRIELEPGGMERLTFGVRVAPVNSAESIELLPADAAAKTEAPWRELFDGVPTFQCSEPLRTGLWDYRRYLLKQKLKIGEVSLKNLPYGG